MSKKVSKKTGDFLSDIPPTPGSSRRKTHYFKENRGNGIIIGLCGRAIRIEQIERVPKYVECNRCREELEKKGLL